jgi:hypothetical protein
VGWINELVGPVGGALFSAGVAWGIVRMSIKQLRGEVEDLKAKKPELLEYRVGQHEEQLKTLRTDLDEFKSDMGEVKVKLDFIHDAIKEMRDNAKNLSQKPVRAAPIGRHDG